MSPTRIQAAHRLWTTQLPAVKPFYAVKCNPEPQLLNTLYDAGVNFDCASERELMAVRQLARGPVASRIVYANPCKSERDLVAAREMDAPVTVVDSAEEVEKLAAGGGYEGGALVRLAVDDTASAMPFSTKFGCGAAEDLKRILDVAAALKVRLRGVSFHVGSGCSDGVAYTRAIAQAAEAIVPMRAAGHDANVLNIGGGFLPDEGDFRRKAIHIRGALMELKDRGLQFWAEPGRFFATDSMDLFVQVIGKKKAAAGYKYTLDDSLYGQFSSILFDYAKPSWIRVGAKKGGAEGTVRAGPRRYARALTPGVLFGRTCDSVDVIARAEEMEELEVGDWLWWPRMGAYTRATASEFNGFPTPPVMVAASLPAADEILKDPAVYHALPSGVVYMPPVSARAFWAAGVRPGKN
jgi:ornithine decarboxylase